MTLGSTPASRMRRSTSAATDGLPATAAASMTLPNTCGNGVVLWHRDAVETRQPGRCSRYA